MFHTPDGAIPLEQLSDGYQNVAAWCGDLLHRVTEAFENYTNPLRARGLLLIDEIDLHLHPRWQRDLRGFFDNTLPHFQILGTTHSPLTAQQCGAGELILLRRDGDKPPKAKQMRGNPRMLRLHEIMEPAFGIATTASREVERLKDRYRALGDKKRLAKAEREEFDALREKLSDIPSDDPPRSELTHQARGRDS